MSLAEHHIYGSSRLGIQRYDTVGYKNAYNINNTIAATHDLTDSVAWYSYQFGDLVNKAYKDPYGHTDLASYSLNRTLGRRYYEMTDHLGNVIATVLDRKTGHLPSGATSYDYWNPDLATATITIRLVCKCQVETCKQEILIATVSDTTGKVEMMKCMGRAL